MTDAPNDLTPATPQDLPDAFTYTLRFSRGKRGADDIMARITAERLVQRVQMPAKNASGRLAEAVLAGAAET